MRYSLCHSCKYFVESRKTETQRWPNHCSHVALQNLFGIYAGGFITGTDVFSCSYFEQYDAMCGDVVVHLSKGGSIAYVIPKERKERGQYVLTDNSKNIVERYEKD